MDGSPEAEGHVSVSRDPEEQGGERDNDEVVFDRIVGRLESLGLLTKSFERTGAAEVAMLQTLASTDRPLRDREGFAAAHRTLARGLEAILVSGHDQPTLPRRFGPLQFLTAPLAGIVTNWIIDGQAEQVFAHVLRLYELREANAVWNSPDHQELRRARMQMQMISRDLGASKLGLPVFLLSGVFVSGLLGAARALISPFLNSGWLTVLLIAILLGLFGYITAVVLVAAAVARMRLRLAMAEPLISLYQAIGDAGQIPKDRCFMVAIGSLVLLGLAVITVPTLLLLFLTSVTG